MGIQDQSESFSKDKLHHARNVAMEICYELSSLIKPGMTEEDAHRLYKEVCQKKGITKQWHPPKLRFGPNTTLTFKEPSAPYILQENDVYFLDIGPVVDGYEADYGEPFYVGSDYEHRKICAAAQEVFRLTAETFRKEKLTGPELYQMAKKYAHDKGYELRLDSDGHRVGEFPHHIIFKGSLLDCEETVVPDAWILEIHLFHPKEKYAAFFEDILI